MRLLVLTALMLCCGAAFAGDTYRFPRGIVTVGDAVSALMQRAGKPDRTVQLENKFGAANGERWEYYLPDGKMVTFFITDSRIYAIDAT